MGKAARHKPAVSTPVSIVSRVYELISREDGQLCSAPRRERAACRRAEFYDDWNPWAEERSSKYTE